VLGFWGNHRAGVSKPATLETGAVISVSVNTPDDIYPPSFDTEIRGANKAVGLMGRIDKGTRVFLRNTNGKSQVPGFISVGDMLDVDTRSNEYLKRNSD
jgi:hypothetical protein